ncbi:MAG TPA: hypothetical protein VJ823_01700 [Rhodanobacteraceae bacterium]|nr:hypothetical protein [Rhodanobacteraceae bacterium]
MPYAAGFTTRCTTDVPQPTFLLCIGAECALTAWPYLSRILAHH